MIHEMRKVRGIDIWMDTSHVVNGTWISVTARPEEDWAARSGYPYGNFGDIGYPA